MEKSAEIVLSKSRNNVISGSRVSAGVSDGGFCGLADGPDWAGRCIRQSKQGHDPVLNLFAKTFLNEAKISYLLPMTNTGLEPGGYLEVMLQQVCEETSPNKLKLHDHNTKC